jgi:hypothetical protein
MHRRIFQQVPCRSTAGLPSTPIENLLFAGGQQPHVRRVPLGQSSRNLRRTALPVWLLRLIILLSRLTRAHTDEPGCVHGRSASVVRCGITSCRFIESIIQEYTAAAYSKLSISTAQEYTPLEDRINTRC